MTSIDWLLKEIHEYYMGRSELDRDDIIDQAKEMHKAENIDFAKHCLDRALDLDIRTVYQNIEQYYNETYKKD